MLLSTTALGTIAYQRMQPPSSPKEVIVYREAPPPKIIGPCPPKLGDRHSEDRDGPCLPKAEKILAYQSLLLRAGRLFPDGPNDNSAARWKYVYEQIDKDPTHYVYWN